MPRQHRPWFRKQTGWWMVEVAGHQVKLAKGKENKAEAEQAFHKLMAQTARQPYAANARTVDVIEGFLRHSRLHYAPDTYRIHKYYCQLFAEACGQVPARDLRPFHISRWVDEKRERGDWGEATVFNAKRIAFRVFSWATEEGMLNENPLKGMKRPKPAPRQRAITEEEFLKIYAAGSAPFQDYLLALYELGARPKELRDLQWSQVQEDRLILKGKTFRKTGKARIIFLTPNVKAMLSRLKRGSGHVFLNTRGVPWTMNAVRLQFSRIRKALGLKNDVCAYLCRHGFGTRAILSGVNPAVLMELMGHNSMEMISKVYVHLADQHQHLKEAVEKITPAPMPLLTDQHPVRRRAQYPKAGEKGDQPSSLPQRQANRLPQ